MPRNLLVPGKNALGSSYRKDSQTIEQWARQPIQQLIAGSGVTLSPASGLATDSKGNGPNPITISASGGGGGSEPGFFGVQGFPDLGGGGGGLFYVPLNGVDQVFGPSGTVTNFPIFPDNGNYHDFGINAFSLSWWTFTGPALSVNILPFFSAPNYTSPGGSFITVQYVYWASDIAFANYALYTGVTPNIPSFTQYQALDTDLTSVTTFGGDLSLVAGSGISGNGLITAGGAFPYLAGVSGLILTSSDMTFP